MARKLTPSSQVLEHYNFLDTQVTPLGTGNINDTWSVTLNNEVFVLQRLNPIFSADVHTDIHNVANHLASQGIPTAQLVPTVDGDLFVRDEDDSVWRVQTFISGDLRNHIESKEQAHSSGALLGRFHRALVDFDTPFVHQRFAVHDTKKHLEHLRTCLEQHTTHTNYTNVEPLGRSILSALAGLSLDDTTPSRVVHGDPKVANIIYRGDEAYCLIDLDTLSRMPLPLELGDAFRSWCNTSSEHDTDATFSLEFFSSAVEGYLTEARAFITPDETNAIVDTTQRIALELAARFCADALAESYFAWNREHYANASEHNLIRARGQFNYAMDLKRQAGDAQSVVRSLVEKR